MPRPTTKNDLMTAAKENYEKLNLLISKMTEEELNLLDYFSRVKIGIYMPCVYLEMTLDISNCPG